MYKRIDNQENIKNYGSKVTEIIKNKQAIYDLKVDKTVNKIGNGNILKKFELNKLPEYIILNQNKFSDWID